MKLVQWVRTSSWAPLLLRAVLTGAALLVLGIIGAIAGHAPKGPGLTPPSFDTRVLDGLPVTAAIAAVHAAPADAPRDAGTMEASAPSPDTVLAAAAALPPPVPTPSPHGRATPDAPVYLNEADEAELRRLPGVGAKRADAILELRGRVGRFRRVEDLLRVKGVGRSTLRKWRQLVRLEPRPAPVA